MNIFISQYISYYEKNTLRESNKNSDFEAKDNSEQIIEDKLEEEDFLKDEDDLEA